MEQGTGSREATLDEAPVDESEVRGALRELLAEAKSGQHRADRANRECPPMERAIKRADKALDWRTA